MTTHTLEMLRLASTSTQRPLSQPPPLALASSRGRAVLERQVIEEAGLVQPALAATTLGATAAAMPAITALYGTLAVASRALLGQAPRDAATDAFLSGFGLATPAAELARRVGLPGVAETIERHPVLSELGLGLTVAAGAAGVQAGVRSATNRLVPSAVELQQAISQGLQTTTNLAPETARRAAQQVVRHVGRITEPVTAETAAEATARQPVLNTATPEMAAVRAVEGTVDMTGTMARAQRAQAEGPLVQRLLAELNQFDPLYRLGRATPEIPPTQNPRYLLTAVKSNQETVRRAFYEGVTDPITLERYGRSLESVFEPLSVQVLGASHQNPRLVRQGMTLIKAVRDVGRAGAGGTPEYLDAARATVRILGADSRLSEFTRRWGEYTDALGQYVVRSGLWTSEQWRAFRDSDLLYVPYRRLREDVRAFTSEGFLPNSRTMVNVAPGIRSFEGSQRAIQNPARAIADYTARMLSAADRYRVGAAMFNVADQRPDLGIVTRMAQAPARTAETGSLAPHLADAVESLAEAETRAGAVIWRNGPSGREFATVNDPLIWRALTGMRPIQPTAFRHLMDIVFGIPKRIFTAATTGFSPRFIGATNPLRDVRDAFARTENALRASEVARGYGESIRAVLSPSPLYRQAEAGLSGVSLYEHPLDPGTVQRTLAPVTLGQQLRVAAGRALTRPLQLVERAGIASDRGPRVAEYMAALRNKRSLVETGVWSAADLRLYAQAHARKVTIDFFDRPAGQTAIAGPFARFAADYIPFFNPAIQGPYLTAQAAIRNPARVGAVAGVTALSTVAAWALKHRSPEALAAINDRHPTERAGFQLFALDNEGTNILRLPLPQELGLVHAATEALLDAMFDGAPEAGRVFAEAVERALPPFLSDLATGDVIAPFPVLQQIQENQRNRQAFFRTPVVPEGMQELPPGMRRRETTASTFDLLAASLRRLPQFQNASPLQVENMARGLFSSVTPILTSMTDPVARALMGAEAPASVPPPPSMSPLTPTSAIVARVPGGRTASEDRYYRMRNEVMEADAAYVQAERTGDIAPATPYLYRAVLADYFRRQDRDLAAYRAQRTAIVQAYARGLMDGAEARRLLDENARSRQQYLRTVEPAVRSAYEEARRLDRQRASSNR